MKRPPPRLAPRAVLIFLAALAAVARAAIVVQMPADGDTLEPSVRNEVEHARALAPGDSASGAGDSRDFALLATNGLSRTALAIRLVSLQRPDGRFFVGTNDVTAAAARLLEEL